MKDKEIFDILEDAENDSMERLIEKCPEISDEQLEKIYIKSEKKFMKQKGETERTKRDINIKMTETDKVEGVERSRRPVWCAPLSMAASLILITGIAVGSTLLLKHNRGNIIGNVNEPPAVTATTTYVSGTSGVSTDKNGAHVTTVTVIGTDTDSTTTTVTTQSVTEATTAEPANTEFIKPFVGQWRYQDSENNVVHIDGKDMGIVDIYDDATYKYTDNNGNVKTGSVEKQIDVIGGSELLRLTFTGNPFRLNSGYYTESAPDEIHFGNGDAARLVRGTASKTYSETAIEKVKDFMFIDMILSSGVGCENEAAFSIGDTAYYKVTDLSQIGSLTEFRALINNTLTGELRAHCLQECDSLFVERDGVLYEMKGGRGSFEFNTSQGVIISVQSDSQFTATAVARNEIVTGQGHGIAVFTKDNGEWKMSGHDYDYDGE